MRLISLIAEQLLASQERLFSADSVTMARFLHADVVQLNVTGQLATFRHKRLHGDKRSLTMESAVISRGACEGHCL